MSSLVLESALPFVVRTGSPTEEGFDWQRFDGRLLPTFPLIYSAQNDKERRLFKEIRRRLMLQLEAIGIHHGNDALEDCLLIAGELVSDAVMHGCHQSSEEDPWYTHGFGCCCHLGLLRDGDYLDFVSINPIIDPVADREYWRRQSFLRPEDDFAMSGRGFSILKSLCHDKVAFWEEPSGKYNVVQATFKAF